ncbi:unnamed protein product [Clonostachys rosea]|uniref:Transcription factor domain-containing protein n=1 Tax=Bionectria ochroleuca TaxID=29856 RepID=A0ABY6TX17_BIOOC|nr:unnamed protein product [Clonostachys rosea]
MVSEQFLFVEAAGVGGTPKLPAPARSFVIRNARARQSCQKSTSRANNNQRRLAPKFKSVQTRNCPNAAEEVVSSNGLRFSDLLAPVDMPRNCICRPKANLWALTAAQCLFCSSRALAARLVYEGRMLGSKLEPFHALGIELIQPHYELLLYSIAAVQQNLASEELALTDENIAAVFSLLCAEENFSIHATEIYSKTGRYLQQDNKQRATHLAGLQRMLSIRGGARSLESSRMLQAFIIRWICTPRGCRLDYVVPQAVPADKDNPASQQHDPLFLTESDILADDFLQRVYDYPSASIFAQQQSMTTAACRKIGMREDVICLVFTGDCLRKDAIAWLKDPDGHLWDALDIQNVFSMTIGNLSSWILENESKMSAAENITLLCIFVVVSWTWIGSTGCGLHGVLSRMRRHLDSDHVILALKEAGLEIWVAIILLITSFGVPNHWDYFSSRCTAMLADRIPRIETFDDLQADLSKYIWCPHSFGHCARIIWETISDTSGGDAGRGLQSIIIEEDPVLLHPSLIIPKPYFNGQLEALVGEKAIE